MTLNQPLLDEINLLLSFPNHSMMQGLKIHSNAEPQMIQAAKRLHQKGIIDQVDGGYLTELGQDLYDHARKLQYALNQ